MSRSPEVPSEALVIRTYADLDAETAAFFNDCYELLILIGSPGLGKTEAMKKYLALKPGVGHLITGKTTPLGSYKECYDFIHRLLIFNDAEVLWGSDNGKTLMRALTEHSHEKMLQWLSSTKQLDHYPTSFRTTSRSAFVMNQFVSSSDPFYAAILDRGHLLYFDPTPLEIHQYVAEWFHDQEVHDFVGQHLHRVVRLTARAYNKTAGKKAGKRDWQSYFKKLCCDESSKLWLVQQLENDPNYATVEDRVKEFIAQGGGCRKTYFNYKSKLEHNGQLKIEPVPVIQCKGKAPAKFDRLELIAQVEAAKAVPSGDGDDGDDIDAAKDELGKPKGAKPGRKKGTTSKKKRSATPPSAMKPVKSVKPAMPEDDKLEEELLDVPETKVGPKKPAKKNAVGKKNSDMKQPKVQKPVRRKSTGKRTTRRDDSHTDSCTVAADTSHLLTFYTSAKCKV